MGRHKKSVSLNKLDVVNPVGSPPLVVEELGGWMKETMVETPLLKTETPSLQDVIDKVVKNVEKKFGANSCFVLGGNNPLEHKEGFVSTGVPVVDYVLGCPGIPYGRIVGIVGDDGSGKTTLALSILASAQKSGGFAGLIETESKLNLEWANKLGVDLKTLVMTTPDTLEDALSQMEVMIEKIKEHNIPGVIVLDSVSVQTKSEVDADIGDTNRPGVHAKILSISFRRLSQLIKGQKIALVFLNQLKDKLSFSPYAGGMDLSTALGGKALKFHATVMLKIEKRGLIKEDKDNVALRSKITVIKHQLGTPFKSIDLEIFFDRGIDMLSNEFKIRLLKGEIKELSPGWYEFNGKKFRESQWKEIKLS